MNTLQPTQITLRGGNEKHPFSTTIAGARVWANAESFLRVASARAGAASGPGVPVSYEVRYPEGIGFSGRFQMAAEGKDPNGNTLSASMRSHLEQHAAGAPNSAARQFLSRCEIGEPSISATLARAENEMALSAGPREGLGHAQSLG